MPYLRRAVCGVPHRERKERRGRRWLIARKASLGRNVVALAVSRPMAIAPYARVVRRPIKCVCGLKEIVLWTMEPAERSQEIMATGRRQKRARRKESEWRGLLSASSQSDCATIIKTGGPTFRTTTRGHVCNQTGDRVARGRCRAYANRISAGRGWSIPVTEEKTGVQMRVAAIYSGCAYCPHCGNYMYVGYSPGEAVCEETSCRKSFKTVCA